MSQNSNRALYPSGNRIQESRCWSLVFTVALVMFCEGFDLIAYSSILPSLIEDTAMGISKVVGGALGSVTFLGMFVGGLSAGKIDSLWGHAKTVRVGIIWFSLAMLLGSISPNLYVLGISRAFAGFGLGVVLPVALSFAREQCHKDQSAFVISVVMAGVPLGGLAAAASTTLILMISGWRMLMVVAGTIGLLLVLGIHRKLARGEVNDIARKQRISEERVMLCSFEKEGRLLLVLLALATFMFLMAYYGISTWLVQLMRELDIPLDNSLQLMMMLNLGCIVGSLLTARAAKKIGVSIIAMGCAFLAAVSLLAIALRIESPVLLFCLIFCAGVGAISAQNLTNTLVSNAFPSPIRATALGFTLGAGRLGAVASPVIGGALLQMGLDAGAVLLFLAIADFLGIILLGLYCTMRRRVVSTDFSSVTSSRVI